MGLRVHDRLLAVSGLYVRRHRQKTQKEEEKSSSSFAPVYSRALACIGTVLVYAALMIPAESFYRGCYSNLYFWNSQQQYNSLADETYGNTETPYSERPFTFWAIPTGHGFLRGYIF